jgi:AcrR family transcriptional regulator
VSRSVTTRPGRPRSAAADESIRRATIEVFAEAGFEGLRVEAVAERAGVAKSTLYRRFPSKIDLVRHALGSVADELPCALSDSLADDLVALLQRLRDKFASDPMGRAVPALIEASARHPELREVQRTAVAERRRAGMERLAAAVEHGELPAATDIELLMDQLSGAVFYRSFVTGADLSDATLRRLVASVLAGQR